MSRDNLHTYLNDHLSGSVAAVELLKHLIELHRGTETELRLEHLLAEVEEDQAVLRGLLERGGGKESRLRKATAWLGEKVAQAKLKLDDIGDDQLRILEALEALELGIQGKLSLWRALAAVALPELGSVDFLRLQHRASQQFELVDRERLQAARAALASDEGQLKEG
jgi:hypothetical protein